ncbi:unnamed protein product [Heligmosomoides polygyrus]|uniref:SHSP domain-containing protein n=1 Tax=Heligmosomoides polygyrus TaxID=6339 RepID=A0A183G0C7_HELPZ|nr:unnamed protein product [Heligmosomoides polygyrus]
MMLRLRVPAEYTSKMKHRWAGHLCEEWTDKAKNNSGVDSKRVQASSRKVTIVGDDHLTISNEMNRLTVVVIVPIQLYEHHG